jgi:hypothetical protein
VDNFSKEKTRFETSWIRNALSLSNALLACSSVQETVDEVNQQENPFLFEEPELLFDATEEARPEALTTKNSITFR